MKRLVALAVAGVFVASLVVTQSANARMGSKVKPHLSSTLHPEGIAHFCNTNGMTCTEPYQNWGEFPWFDRASQHAPMTEYIGHDEPSVLFYSQKPGSGHNNTYILRLPKDAPKRPRRDASGGTWNFQLHPAFWFGMAMCDNQSAPNPGRHGTGPHHTRKCAPDSNSNIYRSLDSTSSHYIGLHPGIAFMEMQFYPPGWIPWPPGNSCTGHRWCAALNIDSLSENMNTGGINNSDCLNRAGIEPVNFAFITKNGHATAPANPLNPNRFTPVRKKDFLMNPGDTLRVYMHDTPKGFKVSIHDFTTGTTGRMKASVANGFGHVKYAPGGATCHVIHAAFHPAYNKSTPNTRVPWAAHSYNVAYSDEIGHFEYCKAVVLATLNCGKGAGADNNAKDVDDNYCFPGFLSTLIKIPGCYSSFTLDGDFDGPSYQHDWPGSTSAKGTGLHSQPIVFTTPTFRGKNYGRVAFETDLGRIEDPDTVFNAPPCQRHISNPADPHPGRHCVNPPPGAAFYPMYVMQKTHGHCTWKEGGKYLRATRKFGKSSKHEFGPLLKSVYPAAGWTLTRRYNNFRRILPGNPCRP